MPTFIMISRHSVENCPMNNEKTKKLVLDVTSKLGELANKHGIKIVGSWTVIPEHLMIQVYEAPSLETFLKLQREPEIMKWIANNTTEIKLAMTAEESIKLLK